MEKRKNLQISLFGHDFIFKSLHPLFDAWSLLLIHVWFTLSEGPKSFKFSFLINLSMEV